MAFFYRDGTFTGRNNYGSLRQQPPLLSAALLPWEATIMPIIGATMPKLPKTQA